MGSFTHGWSPIHAKVRPTGRVCAMKPLKLLLIYAHARWPRLPAEIQGNEVLFARTQNDFHFF